MAAFPLLKLGVLAIRQISKPLANHLKTRAKESHFFRTKICMPPAQFYHWCEVNVKARLLNLSSPKEVVKLNEQAAIDLGSELLGDLFMFSIGAAAVIAEYTRQSRKSAEEKAALETRLSQIESNTNSLAVLRSDLETRIAQMETSIDEIKELVKKRK
jgi:hypothetical protein